MPGLRSAAALSAQTLGAGPTSEDAEPHLRLLEVILSGIQRWPAEEQSKARLNWLARNLPKTAGWLETKLSWGRE